MNEEFLVKYKGLFDELAKIDKDKGGSRARIECVKNNPNYMQLVEDAITLVSSVKYSAENSSGQGYYKRIPKNFDSVVFLGALDEAIKYFKVDIESFISLLKKLYKEKSAESGGAKVYDEKYGTYWKSNLSIKKKAALRKLCGLIERYHMQYGISSKEAYDYIINCIENGELKEADAGLNNNILSKDDIESAKELALITNGIISLDKGIDSKEDGGKTTLYEITASEESGIDKLIDIKDDEKTVLDIFIENWDTIAECYGKKHKDFLKAFFSQNILDQLKRKEENGRRIPYEEEPAGDRDFYDYLQTRENELVTEVFHWVYINSAFDKDPKERLDNVYVWLLKKGFKFTDRQLATSLGMQPANVSKKRTRFEERIPSIVDVLLKERTSDK